MREILVSLVLIFVAIVSTVQNAFMYAGCSTLIGIVIFIVCTSIFGGWGVISLIFILPFISKGIVRGKLDNEINEKREQDDKKPF